MFLHFALSVQIKKHFLLFRQRYVTKERKNEVGGTSAGRGYPGLDSVAGSAGHLCVEQNLQHICAAGFRFVTRKGRLDLS